MILRMISVVIVLCGASMLPAAADPAVEVGSVKVEDGRAHVTLTARDVPGSLGTSPVYAPAISAEAAAFGAVWTVLQAPRGAAASAMSWS